MPILTLQPDAAAGADTHIRDGAHAAINFGIDTLMYIGWITGTNRNYRTLIKFDLSTLPAAAVISSAVLSLWCTADYSGLGDTFRVFRQKRAWLPTGATWNRYDTTNNWSTAGGFGADDCEQVDIGSRAFTATEATGVFKDFSLTPTTKAGLDLGNGWLVKGDILSGGTSTTYEFATSNHATAAYRPRLVIDYTLPAAGLLLQLQNHGVLNGGAL